MIRVGSIDAAVIDLGKVGVLLQKAALEGLRAAGQALAQDVRANLSWTCHSLDDLAALDPPYAKRHGTIQIHRERPYGVHTQSGALLAATKDAASGGLSDHYEVWFDLGAAEHARWVVEGTKYMLPRDVLWDTASQRTTRRAMMRAFVRVFGKEFRTKAMIRFRPVSGSGTRA